MATIFGINWNYFFEFIKNIMNFVGGTIGYQCRPDMQQHKNKNKGQTF